MWATPAFIGGTVSGWPGPSVALRLRRGTADLAAVQREITRLAHGKVAQSYPLATQAENTEHSIHLQAVALWLLGAVLGVISLLVIGQLLVRLNFLEASDHDTLRALGVSRGALLAVGLGRAAALGTAGAAAGTLLAVALSPLLPVGLAGIAEPHPGVHADGAVLGLGAAAAVLATVACAAWPAWRRRARPACGPGGPWPPGPGARSSPRWPHRESDG